MEASFCKRAFDVLFAVLFLLVFSPIYVITAVAIVICSPGSPLYKAQRVGKNGKPFTCYKFRSMRVDSGRVRLTTLRNDDRIFPFGKLIRKTKIDEMPQAFNILLGDMSVVGPRPEDLENADRIYQGKYRRILEAKPGLTSPASLYDFTYGEKIESEEVYEREFLPDKLELELYYVEHSGFWYDIKLILKTAGTVLLTAFGKEHFKQPPELRVILQEREKAAVSDQKESAAAAG